MSIGRNVTKRKCHKTKCHWDKMSLGQNVTRTKCHQDKMSLGQNVPRTKCHWDKMLLRQNVTGTKCYQEKMLQDKIWFLILNTDNGSYVTKSDFNKSSSSILGLGDNFSTFISSNCCIIRIQPCSFRLGGICPALKYFWLEHPLEA